MQDVHPMVIHYGRSRDVGLMTACGSSGIVSSWAVPDLPRLCPPTGATPNPDPSRLLPSRRAS